MSINIASNFLLFATLPLDARTTAATTAARDAIPAGQRYDGLTCYVLADDNTYQLQNGITNADWKLFVAGGGTLWTDSGTTLNPTNVRNVNVNHGWFRATQDAQAGGSPSPVARFYAGAHTNMAAGVALEGFTYLVNGTKEWNGAAPIAFQAEMGLYGPQYAFTAPQVMGIAATVAIGEPTAGANCTITDALSLMCTGNIYSLKQYLLNNGSVALPSLSFFADQNSGLRRKTAGSPATTVFDFIIDGVSVAGIYNDQLTTPSTIACQAIATMRLIGANNTSHGPAVMIGNSSVINEGPILELYRNSPAIQDNGTSTAGGASTLTDNTKTWGINAWVGYQVRVISGAGHPDVRTISSNTINTLTVSPAFTAAPTASAYEITNLRQVTFMNDGAFLFGANANFENFPYAFGVISQDDTGALFGTNIKIGLVVESAATASKDSIGISGLSKATGASDAWGLWGYAANTAVTDTGDVIGVKGSSLAIRNISGKNVGLWAYAAGGTSSVDNYAVYCEYGSVKLSGRTLGVKGANVASANDMQLSSGNYFLITGTTDVRRIYYDGPSGVPDWTDGSIIVLQFASSCDVIDDVASAGLFQKILLAGGVDYAATAGDILVLIRDVTNACWREISRTVF